MQNQMKRVDLFDLSSRHFFGMIVPQKSGVEWTNQAGGTACYHPVQEGIFVPLPAHWLTNASAERVEEYHSLSLKDIMSFLAHSEFLSLHFVIPTEETLRKVEHRCEAWVPVFCDLESKNELIRPFAGELVFLTWANSD